IPVPSAACYDPLMAYARDPHDPVTRAFVSPIEMARRSSRLSGRAAFGLDAEEFEALLDRYFPGAASVYLTPVLKASLAGGAGQRVGTDEFDDLVALLLDHRSDDSRDSRWLAYA